MEETLCWSCQNTNRDDCSWFDPDDPKPVEGWEAVEYPDRPYTGTCYMVRRCPNFKRIEERKREEAFPGVYYDPEKRMWCAHIVRRRTTYPLGEYMRLEDALHARKTAERRWKETGRFYDEQGD